MTDYCIQCGDVEQAPDGGMYVEVSNEQYGIYTEVWICNDCIE